MQKTPLLRAVDAAGGQNALATKLGVRQSVVWYWIEKSKRGVPAEYCDAIERETGISRHDLRPDIFGPTPKKGEAA